MTNQHTLQEKTTAMERSIKMAKEIHEPPFNRPNHLTTSMAAPVEEMPTMEPKTIIKTAKQIYDWLTA